MHSSNIPPIIDPFDRKSHLSYAEAGKLWPGGPVSPTSIWRAAVKGKRGVKLPTIPARSRRVTSREAIRWFFSEIQRIEQEPAQPRASRRRELDPELEAACDAAGIRI